ncbi:MAG TPA: hypothetical protein IAB68_03600 [Candidatus Aphodocola excrementigallinarum]|uniref:Uncharacterized protein n=1 Tax=Candidatus Aphodocola excrementigallinarum TaxID=2840670 RepID=A0A9D1LH16_9FIRM|nr:hypothetical protein [Candidatus Aphodocola excrementigallinarum]
MAMKLIDHNEINNFFESNNYICLKPYHIVNNNDTVFVSAGIQPILKDYREGKLTDGKKYFVSQPVIRTQYIDSIDEGYSLAFINSTSSSFNITEEEYKKMIKDWYDFIGNAGLLKKKLTSQTDLYSDIWGDLQVSGKRTFYYYDGMEIGDTTFFTNVTKDNHKIDIDSFSDLGFGLERLRWLSVGGSYYDLYSNSKKIDCNIKAYLSAIALLAVNNVVPSNKNCGYRFRLFSKKLVGLLEAKDLSEEESNYLDECIEYWLEFQRNDDQFNKNIILKEYIRNGNRYIMDLLIQEGYENVSGININIPRDEFIKRVIASGVETEKVRKLVKR